MLITRREVIAGGAASLLIPAEADALIGPRRIAALALTKGVAPINPAAIFALDPTRKGCVLDFTTAAISDGLLFTTATTGGSAPTSGQTIALALARRHTAPLGAGLGDELAQNGAFASDTVWVEGGGWSIGGGVAAKAPGVGSSLTQSVAVAVGGLYRVAIEVAGIVVASTLMGRLTGGTSGNGQNTTVSIGARVDYLVAASGNNTLAYLAGSTLDATFDNASLRSVPARAAAQATSSLRPIWSSANGGKATFDGVDDVLPISFPASFTGESIALAADGSITQASGVSVGTTHNFATSCKMAVLIETLSATERAGVVAYLKSLPIS